MSTPVVMIETPMPEDVYRVLQTHGIFRENLAEQARRLLAMRFYRERVLSLGKAARLAGLDRWAFIEYLSENQTPVLDYDDEELQAEFAAVEEMEAELRA